MWNRNLYYRNKLQLVETVMFKEIFPDFEVFNELVIKKLSTVVAPVISYEDIYDKLMERWATNFHNYDTGWAFIAMFKNRLDNVLLKYNSIWRIGLTDYIENLTIEELLNQGLVHRRSGDTTEGFAELPHIKNEDNEFQLDYIKEQTRMSLNTQTHSVESSLVNNIINYGKQVSFTNIEEFLEEFSNLFMFYTNVDEYNPMF